MPLSSARCAPAGCTRRRCRRLQDLQREVRRLGNSTDKKNRTRSSYWTRSRGASLSYPSRAYTTPDCVVGSSSPDLSQTRRFLSSRSASIVDRITTSRFTRQTVSGHGSNAFPSHSPKRVRLGWVIRFLESSSQSWFSFKIFFMVLLIYGILIPGTNVLQTILQ